MGMSLTEATCISTMNAKARANFGKIGIVDCRGTVNGTPAPIGSFARSAPLYKYITYNSAGTKALDKVSKLVSKQDSLVTFKSAGP
jgi:hypothetical protein